MAALEFIRLLEERGLLAPDIVVEITRQVETSKVRITPEAIARLLVDNGQLTRFQATKLISELNETIDRPRNDPTTALRGGKPIEADDKDSVEDLLPEDWKAESKPSKDHPPGAEFVDVEIVEAELIDEGPKSQPKSQPQKPLPTPRVPKPERIAPPPVSPKIPKVSPQSASRTKRKNAWDSFRILGVGSILVVLLLVLGPLLFWFSQGSADDAYQSALSAYETRNYSQAAQSFSDFAYRYPRNAKASSAKVLSALATVRENAERVSDPMVALQSANDLFPDVLGEDGLPALRPDMTDALLRIADKFIARIDSTVDLKEREVVISQLASLVEMIQDTRFVGAQERAQNTLRLRNLEESVARANRSYQRDTERLIAIDQMTVALSDKNVSKTYDIRRDLLRKYPVLEGDEKLGELLGQATEIQQGLIVDSESVPALSTEDQQTSRFEQVLLSYREQFASSDSGNLGSNSTIFINSKGTLVAINAADGTIRWQRYIDRHWTSSPRFATDTEYPDVTLVMHDQGVVRRYAGQDGALIWENKFDGPVLEPQIDNEDFFVACTSGVVHCLELSSGMVKWSKQFPQELSAPVAGALSKRQRYVVANNSNLYSISRVGGTCDEVEYLGHQPETIKLPPIWILNHLLVFENTGPDYSTLRIFETDSDGQNIQPSSQLPIRFNGHFVVPPEVDGRRFAITTNFGEFAVFEIDPSSTKEKVQRIASIVEKQSSPRITWPRMVGSDLFLAANRIALYEIQVSSQKLNRVWQREDGDEFTGSPISISDGLIHTRIVRGNLGTRVTLVDPRKGGSKWETDLAAPLAALAGNDATWTAIGSQGALFRFNSDDMSKNATIAQSESLGRNQRMVKFTRSVRMPNGRLIVFNDSKPDQMLLVDPKRTQAASKLFSIDLGGGTVNHDPSSVGNQLVLPLSNSQIALVNADQMQVAGALFQPTLAPSEKAEWLNPVALPDGKSVVVADRSRALYKLATGERLVQSASLDLPNPIVGRLAALDNVVFAVSTLETSDQVELFDAVELKTMKSVPLEGRLVWGPYNLVGDGSIDNASAIILLQCDREGLVALNQQGDKLWNYAIERNELIGAPIHWNESCLIGTAQGEIRRIGLSDGSLIASSNIGAMLSAPPVIVGEDLIVPTQAGSVVKLPIPREANPR